MWFKRNESSPKSATNSGRSPKLALADLGANAGRSPQSAPAAVANAGRSLGANAGRSPKSALAALANAGRSPKLALADGSQCRKKPQISPCRSGRQCREKP